MFGLLSPGGVAATSGLLSDIQPAKSSLSPEEENAYRSWLTTIGQHPGSGYNIDQNWSGTDYDYRGFFKKYGAPDVKKGQHFTDEFKLPNHPTFSDESVYFNARTKPFGGHWVQDGKKWRFEPFDKRIKKTIVE